MAKGLPEFKFVIVPYKKTVNVSAALIKFSNQFTNMLVELNVKNVVAPPDDPVTDIVYTISLAVQIDNVDVKEYVGIMYEPTT